MIADCRPDRHLFQQLRVGFEYGLLVIVVTAHVVGVVSEHHENIHRLAIFGNVGLHARQHFGRFALVAFAFVVAAGTRVADQPHPGIAIRGQRTDFRGSNEGLVVRRGPGGADGIPVLYFRLEVGEKDFLIAALCLVRLAIDIQFILQCADTGGSRFATPLDNNAGVAELLQEQSLRWGLDPPAFLVVVIVV